jgi:hypothetical protein
MKALSTWAAINRMLGIGQAGVAIDEAAACRTRQTPFRNETPSHRRAGRVTPWDKPGSRVETLPE